jgi:hypothetical protein
MWCASKGMIFAGTCIGCAGHGLRPEWAEHELVMCWAGRDLGCAALGCAGKGMDWVRQGLGLA